MNDAARSRWSKLARSSAVALGFALTSLVAPHAFGSENYPRAVQVALGTPCPPSCTTCHTRPSGGYVTANTPLGTSLRRAGLECCDTGLLFDTLDALESSQSDSDSDGTPDTEELRAGTDPNSVEGALECLELGANQGCAVPGRSAPPPGWLFALGAGLSLVTLARRRRGGRARHFQ